MTTGEELLKQLGLNPEEHLSVDRTVKTRKKEERIICTCGHSKARHSIFGESSSCSPGKLSCSCLHFMPVLKVSSTRTFMWKSTGTGVGPEHALTKGIVAMAKKQYSGEWLPDAYKCFKCGTTQDVTIYPIQKAYENFFVATDLDFATLNLLLCETCKDNI